MQGYKIAGVYNPPTVSNAGFSSHETECHIVLMRTAMNYYVTTCDVPFEVTSGWGDRTVDHNQYLTYIQAYASQGWELAGLIDMPDTQYKSFSTMSSTIKLIFQAPAWQGAAGGFLSH